MPIAATPARWHTRSVTQSLTEPIDSAPAFPIVAIGSSAGGLAATMELLRSLGPRPGVGVVIVQHLDPKRDSQMVEVLARVSELPVDTARDGERVACDHVYVLPPNANVRIVEGLLRLDDRAVGVPHRPIDTMFQSLAESCGTLAIGVVLSGTGSDGSRGTEALKAEGGLTFAQDGSAGHAAMPESAIATACVDLILNPDAIGREIVRIAASGLGRPSGVPDPADQDAFRRIVRAIERTSQIDFSHYRESTLRRRVLRRTFVHRLSTLEEYADLVEVDLHEREALAEDVLIHVTSFFRDEAAFDALKSVVFPKLVAGRPSSTPIRVWVAGCSTGEEVYSTAMCLFEFLEEVNLTSTPIKLFGTDVSQRAVDRARAGVFPPAIAREVSAGRLQRFFTLTEKGYQISAEVRDRCIFATQDATRDPPLSKMDLISCRNVMIYLGPALQQRVIPAFHFALNDPGYLLLGTSESVGDFGGFSPVDAKIKLYARTSAVPRGLPGVAVTAQGTWMTPRSDGAPAFVRPAAPDIRAEADRAVLALVAPPALVVADDLSVVEFRGHVGAYLEPTTGAATLMLLRLAREELRVPLQSTIDDARATGRPARRAGVIVSSGDGFRRVDVLVTPFTPAGTDHRYFVILFTPVADANGEPAASPPSTTVEDQLRGELAATREYLQSVIDQLQVGNEELRAANEEIVSSNEELQSTNEELQTAKEELQATNEELRTINDEMAERNIEAARTNDDLHNLLSSIALPIVILGRDSRIRRFTPAAAQIFRLLSSDVGRPFSDLSSKIRLPELTAIIAGVLEDLAPFVRTVQREDGRWCELNVRPYRTRDGRVDGTVVSLFDVDAHKTAEGMIAAARDYAESVVDTVRDGLLVLDGKFRVRSVNRSYCETFREQRGDVEGQSVFDLAAGAWRAPELRERLEAAKTDNVHFEDLRLDRVFPNLGRRVISVTGRKVTGAPWLLLSFADVTERALADEAVRKSEAAFRRMLASAADPILISDGEGKIVFANDVAPKRFGYDSNELLGKPLEPLLPKVSRDERRRSVARRKDGTEFPAEVVLSPMDGTDGPMLVAFVTDMTEREEGERKIVAYKEQLQRVAFESLVAGERERRRIAIGLHDRIGQALAVTQMKLAAAREGSSGEARAALDEAEALITDSIAEVRSLTFDLSPPVLYDLGLRAALSWLAEEVGTRDGLDVTFSADGFDPSLEETTATILFRTVRELLLNVTKHARATAAQIALRRVDGGLEVSVEDDGVGFDADADVRQDGFGLFSVREQLSRLGGTFELVSAPGRGTRAKVRLAIAPREQAPEQALLPPRYAVASSRARRRSWITRSAPRRSNGLVSTASKHPRSTASIVHPVVATRPMSRVAASPRSRFAIEIPSSVGNATSSITTEGRSSIARRRPSGPVAASITS